ncbi:unnamed protein product [Parnassius mnemosyne]|uniref:DUF7869 domain-containing protein n=1 Tax=Parnassius mnemosyne TaxID=213953 RepID=A0AAV1LRV8_9NEOP
MDSSLRNSRGRRILALINHRVDGPPKTVSDEKENDDTNEIEGNVSSKEHSSGNTQRSRSNSSSSSSSSNSSTSSSSSTSFIEDSDDSVKDPPYQPPDSQAPVSPIMFDYFSENDNEQFRQLPVQSDLVISSDANHVPDQENTENAIKKRGKRKRDENNWQKNVMKKLRNEGKSYVSTSKKIVPARKIKNACFEKCKLKCSTMFTEAERMSIFDDYWSLGSILKQWNYISNCIEDIKPKYRYVREGGTREKRRYNSAFYFNLHEEKIRVCKLFFKNTLGITDRPIRTVLDKKNKFAGNLLADDNRGKHKNHAKVDDTIRKAIKEHIDSIPRMDFHYCRATSSKEYIDGGRSIVDIHKDYIEICKSKNIPYGNYTLFYRIFTEEYNISLFQPKKDRCDCCVAYDNCEGEEKEKKKQEYDTHLKEKDLCRAEKVKDKENKDAVVAVYDMQAVFQCPKGDISLFYYVSKLNVFNFTIYDLHSKDVECYVWDEATANRDVNDLGTCLFKYLQNLAQNNSTVDVIFYTDNCVGQQKNKIMLSMYMFAVQHYPNIKTITHKYLIKGHTQNEGDSAHSLIERQVKKQIRSGPMYTPESFISAIKVARSNPTPFRVNIMNNDDFLDWKDVCSQMGVNITKDEEGNTIKFADLKVVKVDKNHPRAIFFKTSYEQQEFKKA